MIGSGAQVLFLNVHYYIAPGPLASLNLNFLICKTRELDQVSSRVKILTIISTQ